MIKKVIFDLGGVIIKGKRIAVLDNVKIDKETYDVLKIFFDDWWKLDLGLEIIELI